MERMAQPNTVETEVALMVPRVGDRNVGAVEGMEARAAEEFQGAVYSIAEDLDGLGGAGFSGGSEAVGVGAADEDGPGAEAEGFHDVRPATDAAVEQDFGFATDSGDDFRQDTKR